MQGAGLDLDQGLASPFCLAFVSLGIKSSVVLLCAPQWWPTIHGNVFLIPSPSSQTCLSFMDPVGCAPSSSDSPLSLSPMTLLSTNLCPQSHEPFPFVLAMPLLGWQDPTWSPVPLICGYTGFSMTAPLPTLFLEPRMRPPLCPSVSLCVSGTPQPRAGYWSYEASK